MGVCKSILSQCHLLFDTYKHKQRPAVGLLNTTSNSDVFRMESASSCTSDAAENPEDANEYCDLIGEDDVILEGDKTFDPGPLLRKKVRGAQLTITSVTHR
jgi:hypothetical protein